MNHKTVFPTPHRPCRQRPDDWLDPRRAAAARARCLTCPALSTCRQEALRNEPTYGTYAGVWIDHDFPAKRHLLCEAPPQPLALIDVCTPAPVSATPRAPATTRKSRYFVGPLPAPTIAAAVAAQITARASAHCEIMAPACTFQQRAIYLRRRAPRRRVVATAADALATCANCLELIEHTDIPTALDLGYIVDPRTSTTTIPVFWRHRHWVYLDVHGSLHPLPPARPAREIA
ncbi:WhiB family transcriptional regulator [Mycobacteroides chelonae]|uniref:WhiB family transcriptional regulator n=2 Tax=Mycobacteroides chelonae TaxID=1774 RepID=UPI0012FFA054|nr:WhiB family transcriptional regulator [Mycobacteroides chelonae]